MKALALAEKKARIGEIVFSSDNEELINRLLNYAEELCGSERPCQYTEQELRDTADKAVLEVEEGRLTDHEILRKRFTA